MSMISPSSYQAVCNIAQESRNSTAAAAAASSVNLRGAVTSVEQCEGDEGEEPRDVEIEPVRQRELEADQERGGDRSQLQDRLTARHEGGQDRSGDDEHLQHLLDDVQVRDAGGVVLAPAPDREGRVAVELEAERALGEDTRSVQRLRLEQEDQEGGDRGPREAECEPAHGRPEPVRIREPERREQQRCELRPARQRDRAAAS